jgi:hypothetical protein
VKIIDVLIPATLRPDVLNETLAWFRKNMLSDQFCYRVHMNVDPVGLLGVHARDVIRCAETWRELSAWRTPDQPHFGRAFRWLWTRPVGDYVLYLEDDWVLDAQVDLENMIHILNVEPDLALLRLPWRSTGLHSMKNWKFSFPWTGRYFECPLDARREVGFCGHPSLVRGDFVRAIGPLLDPESNPEKQFHHGSEAMMAEIDRWRYGVFGQPNHPAAIRDIGRAWMARQGLAKAGSKAYFTEWERI